MSNLDPSSSGTAPSPALERDQTARPLRERAEASAREQSRRSREQIEDLPVEKVGKILHELYVHQIELEMQNEELQRMQAELDAAHARYFDLYELAPSGYCTLDDQGVIVGANLTMANLLDVTRGTLIDQPISRFIYRDDGDLFYLLKRRLIKTGEVQSRELRMIKSDGAPFLVYLVASFSYGVDGASEIRCMVTAISKASE